MGLTTRLDWPRGFKELAEDRVAKGFNLIQINAGPYPDMDGWDPRGRNEAGFPMTENFERINPAYYDHADLKIAHLVESGLMPCIVGMWGYYLPRLGVERARRFWRHLTARYGAYPVVWCACGEVGGAYYMTTTRDQDLALQKNGWTEVMASIRTMDGYHNLLTVHASQFGRKEVADPAVMDFEMLQTGHGDLGSIPQMTAMVKEAVAAEPRMPVINSEINYEGILGFCGPNIQRLNFYYSVLNGTAGHTYGANGIWQMSREEEPYGPSPHGRSWGNTSWREAMRLAGSRMTGYGGRLIQRFRWWELESHPEWLEQNLDAYGYGQPAYELVSVGIPRKLRIVYKAPSCWEPPVLLGLESEVDYRAYYFDPCTGKDVALGRATPDAEGRWEAPIPPECHDWVLVLEADE
jgi:hypothetical protein